MALAENTRMATPKPSTLVMQPSHCGDPYAAVADLLHRCYEGLYRSVTTLVRLAFHSQAHCATASGGERLNLSPEDYLTIIAARTPRARPDDSYDHVVDTIDITAPGTACVRMRATMPGKHFIDLLSLIRLDGK
jgi:4-oxalocrotonate tautomerase